MPPKVKERVIKPDDVKVSRFMPVVLPGQMSGVSIMIYGLGSDNKMYMWDGKDSVWVLV